MKEFKGTKGEFSFSPQKGKKGHCFIAQVWSSSQEEAVVNIESTETEEEANANAELITDAFNIVNLYCLSPIDLLKERQLLLETAQLTTKAMGSAIETVKQHNELKEMLIKAISNYFKVKKFNESASRL